MGLHVPRGTFYLREPDSFFPSPFPLPSVGKVIFMGGDKNHLTYCVRRQRKKRRLASCGDIFCCVSYDRSEKKEKKVYLKVQHREKESRSFPPLRCSIYLPESTPEIKCQVLSWDGFKGGGREKIMSGGGIS